MSFLKRIFGKGTPESDERFNEELEKIESGEIKMVYPILKPGDWVGLQTGAINMPLFGTQENPVVVIALGFDAPENFVFLTRSLLDGKDPEEVAQKAFENLEAYEQEFESTMIGDSQVLTASGQDFSSEKILCQSHMLKAHELLNAEELLVSVPRRRCLMVIDKKVSDEVLDQFLLLHRDAWNDDSYGNAPIVNALFVVKGGEVMKLIPLDD